MNLLVHIFVEIKSLMYHFLISTQMVALHVVWSFWVSWILTTGGSFDAHLFNFCCFEKHGRLGHSMKSLGGVSANRCRNCECALLFSLGCCLKALVGVSAQECRISLVALLRTVFRNKWNSFEELFNCWCLIGLSDKGGDLARSPYVCSLIVA